MAKTKSRTTAATDESSKKIRIILGVILLIGIIAAIIAISVAVRMRYKAYAKNYGKLYVDVNGTRYYDDDKLTLKRNSIVNLNCGFESTTAAGKQDYGLIITSTATEETAFTYTLNGVTRMFLNGEDYTPYFDVSDTDRGYQIANVDDTPESILAKRYAGDLVIASTIDPTVSYFKLTVYSKIDNQSISFALMLENVKLELDPEGGIIF